ncbi:hypothetical protein GALMADRAFT_269008 [Galerina marginata CBS 339.88]|uniref:Uncharacterized protein n=1 Tax=Galerina marginata (strain CBS 339.88) TaxID=685588 RepID=A0A067SUX0_GALM3|nr:hypothetical protein GALMADRAFT_269008 [Galerina marginata CBS 339.88]
MGSVTRRGKNDRHFSFLFGTTGFNGFAGFSRVWHDDFVMRFTIYLRILITLFFLL